MSLTPFDPQLDDDICTICNSRLTVNDAAITHHNGGSLLVCHKCADTFMGAMIQDFADLLDTYGASDLVLKSRPERARRIADALDRLRTVYMNWAICQEEK